MACHHLGFATSSIFFHFILVLDCFTSNSEMDVRSPDTACSKKVPNLLSCSSSEVGRVPTTANVRVMHVHYWT